jgi:hypothetical protein
MARSSRSRTTPSVSAIAISVARSAEASIDSHVSALQLLLRDAPRCLV